MQIETNITNWSVNETNIKITGIFDKTNSTCTSISMPHILGFESNHLKIKTFVKNEKRSNKAHFGLGPSIVCQSVT